MRSCADRVAGPAGRGAVLGARAAWGVVVNLLAGGLIGVVPDAVLVPLLAGLLVSSVKVWRPSAAT